jgi:hypothetical protein
MLLTEIWIKLVADNPQFPVVQYGICHQLASVLFCDYFLQCNGTMKGPDLTIIESHMAYAVFIQAKLG